MLIIKGTPSQVLAQLKDIIVRYPGYTLKQYLKEGLN